MQHNEIERTRFSYVFAHQASSSLQDRSQTKTSTIVRDEPFQFNIPSIDIAYSSRRETMESMLPTLSKKTSSICRYPLLTQALLAEHDRLHGIIPSYHCTKRDNLLKWTQDLASYDRLSPPCSNRDIPLESFSDTSSINDHRSTEQVVSNERSTNKNVPLVNHDTNWNETNRSFGQDSIGIYQTNLCRY
jgi:hypothetical protein